MDGGHECVAAIQADWVLLQTLGSLANTQVPASAKISRVLEMAAEAREAGRQVLVFSSWTATLFLLERALTDRGILSCRCACHAPANKAHHILGRTEPCKLSLYGKCTVNPRTCKVLPSMQEQHGTK